MLVTDQVCMRPLINAPIEMDSMLVFALRYALWRVRWRVIC